MQNFLMFNLLVHAVTGRI